MSDVVEPSIKTCSSTLPPNVWSLVSEGILILTTTWSIARDFCVFLIGTMSGEIDYLLNFFANGAAKCLTRQLDEGLCMKHVSDYLSLLSKGLCYAVIF